MCAARTLGHPEHPAPRSPVRLTAAPTISKLGTLSRLAPSSPKPAVLPGSRWRTRLDSRGSDLASHKSARLQASHCVWASSQKTENITEVIFKMGSATCYVENCVISGDGEDSHFVMQIEKDLKLA